jgi:hypothetical protein
MDYATIYDAFIANRQGIQPKRPAYSERHHIVPRALGGTDDKSNLIRLTPEDHFFAHLLLAKIHGGQMWAPVAFMVGGTRKDYKPTVSRKRYGWVCRALSKALSGTGAHQFDFTIRELWHKDGRRWSGTQYDMHVLLGISRSLANLLVKGRVKSALGWSLPGVRGGKLGGEDHPMHRKEVHHFAHVDGREFVGTQYEFHKAHGVSKPAVCQLARGKVKVWNGWHLKGAKLPTHGRASRWGRAYPQGQSAT